MFSTLRTRFGIPGVISVIALVFAMFGGAYAASNSSGGGKATASAKAKKGPRGPKGATGPAGPQGLAGPQGAKGDAGANGSNGTNGTNGASAEAVSFAGNQHGCTEGGVEVKSAKPAAFVCNGKKGEDGETGFTEKLPSGKTETGTWSVFSFTIPLAAAPAVADIHYLPVGGGETTECPGTVAKPEAARGQVCIYTEEAGSLSYLSFLGFPRPFTSGVVINFFVEEEGNAAIGTWAVTAG